VTATFPSKPLFDYGSMVLATLGIASIAFTVWLHRFLTMGAGANVNAVFGIATMPIAMPPSVKVFNWLFTMYGGSVAKPPDYEAIVVPKKNSGVGFVVASVAVAMGVALVWHIWWLALLAFAGVFAIVFLSTWDGDDDILPSAQDIARIEALPPAAVPA